MNRFTQIVINLVAFIIFFILFTFIFFPFETLVENYLASIEKMTNGKYRVTVGSIDPSIFFKTEFKNFQLISLEGGKNESILYFPSVKAGVKYIPLLGGDVYSSFEIKGKRGTLEGDMTVTSSKVSIDTQFNKFSIQSFPIVTSASPVELDGKISGKIDLNFSPEGLAKAEGKIDLKLIDWTMFPTQIEEIGLEIPGMQLSKQKLEGKLAVDIKKGKFTISSLDFPGEDLKLKMNGWVKIGRKIDFSRLKVEGKINLSEEKEQDLSSVLSLVESQKEEDGAFPIVISGKVTKPLIKVGSFKLSQLLGL